MSFYRHSRHSSHSLRLWRVLASPYPLVHDPTLTRPLPPPSPSHSVIVETDSTAIASRVSRPKADTTDIVINEQTLMNAYLTVKDKVQQRIGQL